MNIWIDKFIADREPNMFSFTANQDHAKRKRIFASAYSKTSISQERTQYIVQSRAAKVVRFIESQVSGKDLGGEDHCSIVIRNMFRALQADIFTAFAFSDADGSRFLDNLKGGANTLEDLGMRDMDLFHDEHREKFFFWESEVPFQYIRHLIASNSAKAHALAEQWIQKLIHKYDTKSSLHTTNGDVDFHSHMTNMSVYDRLLMYKDSRTGFQLSSSEKASEIMDHVGT